MARTRPSILILTYSSDEHVPLVTCALGDARVVSLCSDRPFEFLGDPTNRRAALSQDGVEASLDASWQVWNRRPFWTPGLESPVEEHSRLELRASVVQCLRAAVPADNWINWPEAADRGQDKVLVLLRAIEAGLAVPRTVVTNQLAELRAAFGDSPFVAKPARITHRVGHELRNIAYARQLTCAQVEERASGRQMLPMMAQERIEKVADWRVTWVDGRHDAARMTGTPAAELDFRRAYHLLDYERVRLLEGVEQAVHRLMLSLGLRYGALDFVEDAAGRLWFLEVNPYGQFGWLERGAGGAVTTLGDLRPTQRGPCEFSALLAEALTRGSTMEVRNGA